MEKRKIRAKEIIGDIRTGMDDAALIAKYGITHMQLTNLFNKLIEKGLLDKSELGERLQTSSAAPPGTGVPPSKVETPNRNELASLQAVQRDILNDIRAGMDDLTVMEKYDIAPSALKRIKLQMEQSSLDAVRNSHSSGNNLNTNKESLDSENHGSREQSAFPESQPDNEGDRNDRVNSLVANQASTAQVKPSTSNASGKWFRNLLRRTRGGKYQPDRPDILINTDWGFPEESLSKAEAKQRKLILYKGRWITRAEKRQLKLEKEAYQLISILVVVTALFGFVPGSALGPIQILFIPIGLVLAYGVSNYLSWARSVMSFISVMAVVLGITMITASSQQPIDPRMQMALVPGVLVGPFALYALWNARARKIFGPRREN